MKFPVIMVIIQSIALVIICFNIFKQHSIRSEFKQVISTNDSLRQKKELLIYEFGFREGQISTFRQCSVDSPYTPNINYQKAVKEFKKSFYND